MIESTQIAGFMLAFNAARALAQTGAGLPAFVDIKIVVDGGRSAETGRLAQGLGLKTFVHNHNRGHGRNQQTYHV